MRVQIASDLHLEQGCTTNFADIITPAADLLVLAGDIAPATHSTLPEFIRYVSRSFSKVMYVPGNHERYSHDASMSMCEMDMHLSGVLQPYDNVSLLNNRVEEWRGFTFVGSTMWTHIPPADELEAAQCVNDYRFVLSGEGEALRPQDTSIMHGHATEFLKRYVTEDSVVITHHCPRTSRTSHQRYVGSSTNCAFATHVALPIMPQLWISGHTHYNHDFTEGSTRFMSNQYRNENYRLPHARGDGSTVDIQ